MEFWPAHSSSSSSKRNQSNTNKGKGKAKSRESWTNYPIIDHGAQSAATLVKVGDELEWRTVLSSRRGSLVTNQGEPSKIYPRTRPKEVTNINASLRKRAEHGANFLRRYHPDVDIPFEVVKDALQDDDKYRKQIADFDPYSGNTLSATYSFEGIRRKAIALAFPIGTLCNELNISPITMRANSVTFQPRTQPVWTFDSPIRQIAASSPAVNMDEKLGCSLAVRTYGQVSIFDIRNQITALPESKKPPFALSEVVSIYPGDLQSSSDGGIVNMSFSSFDAKEIFLVTETGAGYRCSLKDEQRVIKKIFDAPLKSECRFWRIIGDQFSTGGIVASDRSVQKFDTRVSGTSVSLLDYEDGLNVITSICPSQTEHLLCLSTTSQIIWLDERYPKQPLLGWRHHRAFDRSLNVQTIEFGNTSVAFLGSSKNSLVSAIAVGKVQDGPLQCQMSVCALPSSGCDTPIAGRTLIHHPGDPSGSFSLLELSAQGSLHHQELQYITDESTISPEQEHGMSRFDYMWSDEVHELERRSRDLKLDYGNLAEREAMKVNLSGLYEALFGKDAQKARAEVEEANAEEVYETLENMPTYWQRSDTGEEHMRTLFDVAFESSSEPLHEARADFFTGTILDSARGYRAHKQGRIPVAEVAKKAGWHTNIRSTLQKISPDVFKKSGITSDTNDVNEGLEGAESCRVERDEPILEADRREAEAREQLALDLALASDVFSPVPIKNTTLREPTSGSEERDPEDASFLTQETEKLSLSGKEPPHVKFGFLRPVNKTIRKRRSKDLGDLRPEESEEPEEEEGEDEEAEDGETAKMPLGVRLLLSEWTIGEDPYAYEYVDPYDLDSAAAESQRTGTQTQARRRQQRPISEEADTGPVRPIQSQAPPTIVASRTLSTTAAKARDKEAKVPPIRVQTQTQHPRGGISQVGHDPGSSQPSITMPMANTQIEPGRFGGRQPVVKKPVKKRMGGF